MAEQETPEGESEETVDPLELFPSEIHSAVEGLTYLGQLTDVVRFCGHTFGLRTLRPQHKMAIAMVLQPYRNTVYEVDVYQALHVGMALTSVDGHERFCDPIGPDLEGLARGRLQFVSDAEEGWYPPTIEFLWNRYVLLEATASKAIVELDRLSQRGQPTVSPPWLDSLIGQGHSPDETSSDTQPSTPSNSD